jgi:hypothetical protein
LEIEQIAKYDEERTRNLLRDVGAACDLRLPMATGSFRMFCKHVYDHDGGNSRAHHKQPQLAYGCAFHWFYFEWDRDHHYRADAARIHSEVGAG